MLDRAPAEGNENILLYFVKFKGHSDEYNEWLLPQPSFQKLINAFNRQNPIPR